MRRSWFLPCSALLAACAANVPCQSNSFPAASAAGNELLWHGTSFSISHDNSRVERWPFGLNEVTTKFVAEPAASQPPVASYWLVRSARGASVTSAALTAEVLVRPEFPGSAFEPVAGVDFELVTGVDRNGAETRELSPGRLEVRVPAEPDARQRGFAIRARFPGDEVAHEPPKSLIVEVVRLVDDQGRELPLVDPRVARWLIVE